MGVLLWLCAGEREAVINGGRGGLVGASPGDRFPGGNRRRGRGDGGGGMTSWDAKAFLCCAAVRLRHHFIRERSDGEVQCCPVMSSRVVSSRVRWQYQQLDQFLWIFFCFFCKSESFCYITFVLWRWLLPFSMLSHSFTLRAADFCLRNRVWVSLFDIKRQISCLCHWCLNLWQSSLLTAAFD